MSISSFHILTSVFGVDVFCTSVKSVCLSEGNRQRLSITQKLNGQVMGQHSISDGSKQEKSRQRE